MPDSVDGFRTLNEQGGKNMPYINVSLYPGQSKEKKQEIGKKITKVIREELPAVPEQYIWVTFTEVPGDEWMIAGNPGPKPAE